MTQENYEIQQKFTDFYNKNLKCIHEQLEPVRKIYLKKFGVAVFSYTIFIFLTMISIKYTEAFNEILTKFFAVISLICFYFCRSTLKSYKQKTKQAVLDKVLSFWGNFRYNHHAVSKNAVEQSEIFKPFDTIKISDSFMGHHKGIHISVAETELSNHINCLGSTRRLHFNTELPVYIFKGVLISLDFKKKFKGKTIVKNRGNINFFCTNFFSHFCQKFEILIGLFIFFLINFAIITSLIKDIGLILLLTILFINYNLLFLIIKKIRKTDQIKTTANKNITLNDTCFNKKWKIMAENPNEAKHILTPMLMEKINNIKCLFHSNYIDFGFNKNKLIIAIHTKKNMFETSSLFETNISEEKVKDVINQLQSITSIIDALK